MDKVIDQKILRKEGKLTKIKLYPDFSINKSTHYCPVISQIKIKGLASCSLSLKSTTIFKIWTLSKTVTLKICRIL